MRQITLITTVAFAALLSGLGVARINSVFAQPQSAQVGTRASDGRERANQRFARFPVLRELIDANGDGAIDQQERDAAREKFRQRALKRFDRNENGVIDDGERPLRRKARGPIARHIRQQILQQFDSNHDGKLDEAERTAARDHRRQKALEKFDANHDGQLDDQERIAAREQIRSKMIGKIREHRRQAAPGAGAPGFRGGPPQRQQQ